MLRYHPHPHSESHQTAWQAALLLVRTYVLPLVLLLLVYTTRPTWLLQHCWFVQSQGQALGPGCRPIYQILFVRVRESTGTQNVVGLGHWLPCPGANIQTEHHAFICRHLRPPPACAGLCLNANVPASVAPTAAVRQRRHLLTMLLWLLVVALVVQSVEHCAVTGSTHGRARHASMLACGVLCRSGVLWPGWLQACGN